LSACRAGPYVSRILRLTLLAPDIVEAILDGHQPTKVTLAALMRPLAANWADQMSTLMPDALT